MQARGQRRGMRNRKEMGVHAAWNHQWPHLLRSAFKRKGGSRNGSPDGLRGKIKAEGTYAQFSHSCLALVSTDHRSSPESSPGMSRETERGRRGGKIEPSPQNSRSLTCYPHSSHPLRLRVPVMHPCGSHKPTLWPPHPNSLHFSTQTWEGSFLKHTCPWVPTRAQRHVHALPVPHLKVSVGPTLRAAAGQSTAPSRSPPEDPVIKVSRHSFSVPAMPILSPWDSGTWKGRKDNWTHTFFSLNILIINN